MKVYVDTNVLISALSLVTTMYVAHKYGYDEVRENLKRVVTFVTVLDLESQQAYVKDSLTSAIQEAKNAKFEGRRLQTIDDFTKEMRATL